MSLYYSIIRFHTHSEATKTEQGCNSFTKHFLFSFIFTFILLFFSSTEIKPSWIITCSSKRNGSLVSCYRVPDNPQSCTHATIISDNTYRASQHPSRWQKKYAFNTHLTRTTATMTVAKLTLPSWKTIFGKSHFPVFLVWADIYLGLISGYAVDRLWMLSAVCVRVL